MEPWRIYPNTPESGALEVVRHRVADQWVGIEVTGSEDLELRNEGAGPRDSEVTRRNFHFIAHTVGGERLSKERQEKLAKTIAGSFALPKGWETHVQKSVTPRSVVVNVSYRLNGHPAGREPVTIGTLTARTVDGRKSHEPWMDGYGRFA